MTGITQETILAMELNQSHIGKLVQIITESWSMTGTLSRVDQHDNREWDFDYTNGGLVPSGGAIYAEVWIGPWRGEVIGNQPVTVETVAGTLEAPERAARPWKLEALVVDSSEAAMEDVVQGDVVDDLPPEPLAEWVKAEPRPWLAANGNRFTDDQAKLITERLLYRPEEPLAEWVKAPRVYHPCPTCLGSIELRALPGCKDPAAHLLER